MSVFAGHEASVWIWTGSHTQSGSIAQYVETFSVNLQTQYANEPAVNGVYYDHLTNRRADASMGGMIAYGNRLMQIQKLETAVHMKVMLQDHTGSAGVLLYSGRIDSLTPNGALGQVWKYGLQYHSNLWSSFNA